MNYDVPVYFSVTKTAKIVGMTSSAVSNAFARGSLKPAAYVDDSPVFDEAMILEWRRNRYKRHRNKFGEQVG